MYRPTGVEASRPTSPTISNALLRDWRVSVTKVTVVNKAFTILHFIFATEGERREATAGQREKPRERE